MSFRLSGPLRTLVALGLTVSAALPLAHLDALLGGHRHETASGSRHHRHLHGGDHRHDDAPERIASASDAALPHRHEPPPPPLPQAEPSAPAETHRHSHGGHEHSHPALPAPQTPQETAPEPLTDEPSRDAEPRTASSTALDAAHVAPQAPAAPTTPEPADGDDSRVLPSQLLVADATPGTAETAGSDLARTPVPTGHATALRPLDRYLPTANRPPPRERSTAT